MMRWKLLKDFHHLLCSSCTVTSFAFCSNANQAHRSIENLFRFNANFLGGLMRQWKAEAHTSFNGKGVGKLKIFHFQKVLWSFRWSALWKEIPRKEPKKHSSADFTKDQQVLILFLYIINHQLRIKCGRATGLRARAFSIFLPHFSYISQHFNHIIQLFFRCNGILM